MSIIYKALQKTQKNRESGRKLFRLPLSLQNNNALVIKSLLAGTALVCILALLVKGPSLKPLFHFRKATPVPLAAMIDANQFRSKNILKGVFLSDHLQLALINNKYYHVGEVVDGLILIDISPKSVLFKNKNEIISLEVPI